MAPEVMRHERYNYAADLYSLGILMWEIITRETPFQFMSQIEAAGSVALEGKRPPLPNSIPFSLSALIEKCWAEQPGERMEVKDVIEHLGELCGNASVEAWLAAPAGHPVYNTILQDTPSQGIMDTEHKKESKPAGNRRAPRKKKISVLKNSFTKRSFVKSKSNDQDIKEMQASLDF